MEIAKGGRLVKVLNETEITKLEALACCLTKSQAGWSESKPMAEIKPPEDVEVTITVIGADEETV